ncbi:MAG: cytochrome c oxidase subunit 3 [Bacteroidota bacterium]
MSLSIQERKYIIHPHKFLMWLFLVTVTMAFAGWTSAYVVQMSFLRPEERIIFQLPDLLWNNLAVILFGSITMQYTLWATRRGEYQKAWISMALTALIGVLFLIGQFEAWKLVAADLPPVDARRKDNLIAYFYLFVLVHGAHIIAAIITAAVTAIRIYRRRLSEVRLVRTTELTLIFWHFLTVIWVYLFVFLQVTQQ